jgi:hypothetical protein
MQGSISWSFFLEGFIEILDGTEGPETRYLNGAIAG